MKPLYCGIDLHSSNAMYVIIDDNDKQVFRKRLRNDLAVVLNALEPFREQLKAVAIESTYNWYWLVDGLMEHGYPTCLANPAAIQQYDGLKDANDKTDAAFLANLCRLDILPQGYIYPKDERPVRDLLRRRIMIVQHRTSLMLSLQNMVCRETGMALSCRKAMQMTTKDLSRLLKENEFLLFTANQQMDLIKLLDVKIKLFEKKVLGSAMLKPEFELLLTIIGIGEILGLTIMYETGDIDRFEKVGDYTSYCRCARAKHISNGKIKKSNNRKNGNKYLSWAFIEAAHHAIRYCPKANTFYHRKRLKKNGALASKALASKWSKAAYYVMKRQEAFDLTRVFG